MARLPEEVDPSVAAAIPIFGPDIVALVVHHQDAELQSLAIRGLEVQIQGVVARVGLGCAPWVIPIEGPEGDIVVGTIVDLLLHDLHRVVVPTPDRLSVSELGLQQLGEMDFVGLAAPTVEVVEAHCGLGLRRLGMGGRPSQKIAAARIAALATRRGIMSVLLCWSELYLTPGRARLQLTPPVAPGRNP